MTEPKTVRAEKKEKRGLKKILLSYFYWTYPRGCFHYDVMVTLILLFIFITPHVWNFGDRPQSIAHLKHPMQVAGINERDMIVSVDAADVQIPAGAAEHQVKKILRKAIQPVIGDAISVEHWETATDAQGHLQWKIWAHK